MTVRIAGFLAGLAIAAPLCAQSDPAAAIDEMQQVSRVNETTVLPALSLVTQTQLASVESDRSPIVIATAANGLRFDVRFRACNENGDADTVTDGTARHCRGLLVTSAWAAVPESRRADFAATAEEFLRVNPAVNAGAMADGSPYLVRYIIADYGTPQGNLVSEFANFIGVATDFQNAIAPLFSE